jgi:glycosyltransferase involved in cell wall biosynthesis
MVLAEARSSAPVGVDLAARVGLVTYDFYPSYGGQGRHTYDLWRHLRALGIDVRVLSPRANNLPGHSRGGGLSLKVGKSLAFSLYATVAVGRWRHANDVDLLHLNGGPGGVILLGTPPAKLVYTAHHTYAQQARNVPGQGWKRSLAFFQGRAYERAEIVTADTPSTAKSLINELKVDSAKVCVVSSGFDPTVFRPTDTVSIDESVLFVGRLDSRKGFDFLIEAWAEVARRRPRARLFVIGFGPLQKPAETYLEEQSILESVVFLGRQPEQELVAWYNRVSAVAVPSRFEGFGLTALESIACGTPVIATDTEGLRDVVVDGVDGVLAPFGDKDAFAQALLRHLERPSRIAPERLAAVEAEYGWPGLAQRYLDVYRRALSG